jgi:hypothetical protein
MTDRECAEILQRSGHKPGGLYSKSAQKHRFECGCGYVSTFRPTQRAAVEAGIIHMRKEAAKLTANGVSLPGSALVSA